MFQLVVALENLSLSIQVCPKKGINPTILLWGWDWDHQTYSREGYGSLGYENRLRNQTNFSWEYLVSLDPADLEMTNTRRSDHPMSGRNKW